MTTRTRPAQPLPHMLAEHLRNWAGQLPDGPGIRVLAHPKNGRPGWDGRPALLTGLVNPDGDTVVSLPSSAHADATRTLLATDAAATWGQLPSLLGKAGHEVERVAFRWTLAPARLPEVGVWVDAMAPDVPEWLRPFGGRVLVALDDDGRHLAGIGIKRHDRYAREIAVVTDPQAQGRGLARMLVAQAARRILASGYIPTYLHTLDNHASSRVAAATGFSDLGWRGLMLSEHPVAQAA